jgi:hypothetical protein
MNRVLTHEELDRIEKIAKFLKAPTVIYNRDQAIMTQNLLDDLSTTGDELLKIIGRMKW